MREKSAYVLLFSAGSLFALLKTLLAAHRISPADFGTYSLLLITAAILSYINSAGIYEAFLVRLNRSRGDSAERLIYRDSGLIASTILSLPTAVIAVSGFHVLDFMLPPTTAMLAAAFFVLNNLLNGLMVEVQADQRPVEYAVYLVAKSAFPVILLLAGFGQDVNDVLVLDLIAMCLVCCGLLWRGGIPSPARFSRSHVGELVREGRAFTANAATLNIANNLDKWAVGLAAGVEKLGVYAFAAQLGTMGLAFASMVQTYMFPRIIEEASDQASPPRMFRRIVALAASSGVICALGISVVVVAGLAFIPLHFPQYEATLPLLPILGLSAVIVGANHAEVIFRLNGRGRDYFLIQLTVLCLTGIACAVLISLRPPLYCFAILFLLGRLAQAIAGYYRAMIILRQRGEAASA